MIITRSLRVVTVAPVSGSVVDALLRGGMG